MEMKVDSQLIKKLREERSWSQEHLAEVAGLSARTVQRVEAEGKASPETKMALAATFGVDVASLALPGGDSVMAAVVPANTPGRGGLLRHGLMFLVVCSMLVFFDVSRHGGVTWSKWPLLGWGVGLLFHWLRTRGGATAGGARA